MTDSLAPHDAALLPGLSPLPLAGFLPLAEQPLLVLVGVTGVGKSTALAALRSLNLLPDRREVTDAVMILPVTGEAVTDREARFALTARYRGSHPGGMAQALGSLHADPALWTGPLVFDGLRGQDEVAYAAEHFPSWRFVSLHAPDLVRVQRLLGRADAFDRVGAGEGRAGEGVAALSTELAALGGIREVFGAAELDGLCALAGQGYAPAEILAKTRIVVSERRNYDPQAARQVLAELPDWRCLDLDTSQQSPQEVAQAITGWLGRQP